MNKNNLLSNNGGSIISRSISRMVSSSIDSPSKDTKTEKTDVLDKVETGVKTVIKEGAKTAIKEVEKKICEKVGKNPCNKLMTRIDPSDIINSVIRGALSPINFIIKLIVYTINFIIEYWNDGILRLSVVFENLIFNLIFTINGYINVFNMIANEIKSYLHISLTLITNNPFNLASIWFTPIILEFMDFYMDSVTINMFARIFSLDFRLFTDFFKATYHFLLGKTIKPNCKLDLYSTNEQKEKNCYEYTVNKCNLNIRTIYNIVFYIIVILYFAGWLSFFKIFYPQSSNTNLGAAIKDKIQTVISKAKSSNTTLDKMQTAISKGKSSNTNLGAAIKKIQTAISSNTNFGAAIKDKIQTVISKAKSTISKAKSNNIDLKYV